MTPGIFIVILAALFGLDWAVLTVLVAIKLSTLMVVPLITGLPMGTFIPVISGALFFVLVFGFWLRRMIGLEKSSEEAWTYLHHLKMLEDQMTEITGTLDHYEGIPIIYNPNVPPGKMYMWEKNHAIVANGPVASVWNSQLESSSQITKKELDAAIKKAQASMAQAFNAKFIAGLPKDKHPRLRKNPTGRTEQHEQIAEVLRRNFEVLHFDGDDTFLRVLDENFSYDYLSEEILRALGEWE